LLIFRKHKMKKIRIVGIASVILVVGIVALDFNKNRIEHINDQLATNPPAAGDGRTFGDIERARSRINDTTAGFRTKPASLSVYKEIEGNVTSFSDIPTRNYSASTGRGEIIQVNTSNPPTTPKPDANQQVKHSKWENQFAMFPQDQDGWSIITPSVDSRMIYVSSSDGDDNKAKAYFSKDIPDPRNPPSSVVAFKTIDEALKLKRDGYPDWILLKKGDEWQIDKTIFLPSGRSSKAHFVMTSYGNSTQRPLINTGVQGGIFLLGSRNFIAIIGIEFYANYRDPADLTNFVGWSLVGKPGGFVSVSADKKEVESILLEDNVFKYYSINAQFNGNSKHKNITVRRNQFLNAYSTTSHSQGMFAANSSILIEENLFEHNGWYQQNFGKFNSKAEGQATFFNHNTYLSGMFDTVIVNNIFSHASSMAIKLTANIDLINKINTIESENIIIDNNLIIDGEVGISAGGNTDFGNGYRWRNITITNNVLFNIGKSQPTQRNLGFHISANDWDGGRINNNYLLCNNNPSVTNISGIAILGFSRNISINNNMVYGLNGDKEKIIYKDSKEMQTDIEPHDNYISTKSSCSDFEYSNDAAVNNLIKGAKAQSMYNWNLDYTASELNARIKSSLAISR